MLSIIGIAIGLGVLAMVAIAMAPAMADVENRGIPGPQDAELVLQAGVTKTVDFDGAGLHLGTGFAPGGIGKLISAVITVTALDQTTGNETYAFHLEESADDQTYVDCGVPLAVAATGVFVAKGIQTLPYSRLVLDVDGDTPSITYSANLNPLA